MHHLERQLGQALSRARTRPNPAAVFLCACLAAAGVRADEPRPAVPAGPPAPRITVPGTVSNIVDGDTLDVELRLVVRVRLLADDQRGCWAPESRTTDLAEKRRGLAAKANMQTMAAGKSCLLSVPITSDRLIDALTLERVLGVIYVDGRSLGAEQIRSGFAASVKGGELGK